MWPRACSLTALTRIPYNRLTVATCFRLQNVYLFHHCVVCCFDWNLCAHKNVRYILFEERRHEPPCRTTCLSNGVETTRVSIVTITSHVRCWLPATYLCRVNASALIIDLNNSLLRAAATALSPAILRIGGSEGDVMCYDVPEYNSTCADMNQMDPLVCHIAPRCY